MSKFEEALELYSGNMKEIGIKDFDADLLRAVTKGLGPSIYNKDSSKVSCSDKTETDRVKANFIVKKLGLPDDAKADAAIKAVCEKMGSSNRSKHRAIFYYLVVKELGQEAFFNK